MIQQHTFDFGRVNFLATDRDHVFDPINDVKESAFIHPANVTRMKPTVFDRRSGVFGSIPITKHHVGSANRDFAQLARRTSRSGFCVDDFHLHVVDRGANRTGREFYPVVVAGEGRSFG